MRASYIRSFVILSSLCHSKPAFSCSMEEHRSWYEKKCLHSGDEQELACLREKVRELNRCVEASVERTRLRGEHVYEAVKAKIDSKTAEVDGDLNAAILDQARIREGFDSRESSILEIKSEFGTFMSSDFENYKESEKVLSSVLKDISAKLGSNDRIELVRLQHSLYRLGFDERDAATAVGSKAAIISYKAKDVQNFLNNEFQNVKSLNSKQELKAYLKPFEDLIRSLDRSIAYGNSRSAAVSAKINEAMEQIQIRIEALRKAEVSMETRDVVIAAIYLDSVARFMEEVESARKTAFEAGLTHRVAKVSFYAHKFQALNRFLDFEPICTAPSKPKWVESGCKRFNMFSVQAKRLKAVGLGKEMIADLRKVKKVLPSLSQERAAMVESLVASNKAIEASALFDAILSEVPQ